jgi:hypothetical protein
MHEQLQRVYALFGFLGVLSFSGLVWVILRTAPEAGLHANMVLFYLLLLLVFFFFGTVIELPVRKRFATAPLRALLTASMRQAALLGVLVVLSLFLQASQLLFWWVAASLVLFFLSLEVFFSI